jgi:NMD protein affecting ribosome stability and mRNA decay
MSEIRLCCRCGAEHDRKAQRMCKRCHAANMQSWRSKQSRMLKRLRQITESISRETLEPDSEKV